MMGWSLQRFLAIRFSATDHNQTVAHVLSLTSRAKPRTGQNILCLHLPLRVSGLPGRIRHFPYPQGWRCITCGFGSSHSTVHRPRHQGATLCGSCSDPGIRKPLDQVCFKMNLSSSIHFSLRHCFSIWLFAPFDSVLGQEGVFNSGFVAHGDVKCANVETLEGAVADRSTVRSLNSERSPGLFEAEETWCGLAD